MKRHLLLCLVAVATLSLSTTFAQDRIHYTGTELSNPRYHDGQLSPVVGVHNIQTMRANRQHPDASNGGGWTYNHQSMLAYWNGTFYMQYLSDVADEHVPPSQTLLMTSKDGYTWTNPDIIFPPYKVPDGFTKPGRDDKAKDLIAIMHQRVGFYVSKSGRLYTMAAYGVAYDKKDSPNDGNGIGRVIREIKTDGTYGPIHFIYFNHGMNPKDAIYPYYTQSKDKELIKACREIMANPLYMMQWVEEADRNDPLIPLHKDYKAFCYYTLPDGRKASLWKHALTSISADDGRTWEEPVLRAKGFVNSNAKIWGQRLSDGNYATVYNPSEFRWPLAISLSNDGLEYTTLNLIHGEITSMRYGGNYKSYGPQYVRGIQEGNGTPPDNNMWLTYSVNKEDMWVARVPVPVRLNASAHANDDFSSYRSLADMIDWNIYSPLWAPVSLDNVNGKQWLTLRDKDPFDYAKVERKIPASRDLTVSFDIVAGQNDKGTLQIEFVDENSIACSRLEFAADGTLRAKYGYRDSKMMDYEPGKTYHVEAVISLENRNITVFVDGKRVGLRMLYAPVHSIERVLLRTGAPRDFPTPETPTDPDYDLERAGDQDPESWYRITNFNTSSADKDATAAVLKYADFSHYADYFNGMEDENIVQAIPNSESSAWMEQNIPLFECPQKNFEEMYYYRWWSLRKHIKETPVGYGMTEFLVNRSYADKYNLIACAIGHHIYESRWLRNRDYLDQIIRTWYRGNEGKPMAKMMNFSSWNIDAMLNRYMVDGNKDFLFDMKNDLEEEYKRWESTHRLPNGLYWQGDVQDGMEESISGGRRKKYARPTINSYMYGNAKALYNIGLLSGDERMAMVYSMKADTLKQIIQEQLWNAPRDFFETRRTDSLANAREAIGYIPWYFNLPDTHKYDAAWKQITDEGGFSAPYGLTTAERRHPEFRTRGVGKCEWDGAIWPFASSQTLTAMANFMNLYPQTVLTDSVYFRQMELYVESQYHRGRPYIGEYLDEVTGYWLKGDQERSRYYNHSTFNDLIITGLVGLRPRFDNTLEVNPLIPEDKWDWFCLDNVSYHGHNITILWDKDGTRYHRGKGLRIFVDGKEVGHANTLTRIVCEKRIGKE
ncbi:glycosyl hydrolase family 65 protein [Bacteroides sp. 51]|uniref:MGH1-like glycoside hydrolase domain-containing protein n=1 Tax=Bacteroides sp. 51 TaxID=2302938 RepID=UPI0013D14209|nr:glycosyl hydrolase family 65 protein [Bacteroides sp. 51]NDV83290.1 six-hairpin glycosidase [Bacteroides sp. 51]